MVQLQKSNYNIGIKRDPLLFSQTMKNNDHKNWYDAIKRKFKSMDYNGILELIELLNNYIRDYRLQIFSHLWSLIYYSQ